MSLLALPNELLALVVQALPLDDVVGWAQTCLRLRDVAFFSLSTPAFWKAAFRGPDACYGAWLWIVRGSCETCSSYTCSGVALEPLLSLSKRVDGFLFCREAAGRWVRPFCLKSRRFLTHSVPADPADPASVVSSTLRRYLCWSERKRCDGCLPLWSETNVGWFSLLDFLNPSGPVLRFEVGRDEEDSGVAWCSCQDWVFPFCFCSSFSCDCKKGVTVQGNVFREVDFHDFCCTLSVCVCKECARRGRYEEDEDDDFEIWGFPDLL